MFFWIDQLVNGSYKWTYRYHLGLLLDIPIIQKHKANILPFPSLLSPSFPNPTALRRGAIEVLTSLRQPPADGLPPSLRRNGLAVPWCQWFSMVAISIHDPKVEKSVILPFRLEPKHSKPNLLQVEPLNWLGMVPNRKCGYRAYKKGARKAMQWDRGRSEPRSVAISLNSCSRWEPYGP